MEHNQIVRYVLRVSAVTTLVIGLGLLFYADPIAGWFSNNSSANEHFAVYLGTALVGFAVMNWLFSNSKNLQLVSPAIYGNLASLLTAIIIDVTAILLRGFNKAAWSILFLHVLFAVAFSYCLMIMRRISS